jgi:hypothetical protein
MIVKIPLRRRDGTIRAWTTVDGADYAELSGFSWSMGSHGYVRRGFRDGGKHYDELLARRLMGLGRGDSRQVDHLDRDKLNNRRANLRIVEDTAANCQNREARPGASSYRGVAWDKAKGKWYANGRLNWRRHFLGYFDDEQEAAAAAAEWRRVNMPYSEDAMR